MKENKRVLSAINTKKTTLLIFLIFEVLGMFLIIGVFNKFQHELKDFPIYFKYIFLIFYIVGFIIVDAWFLKNINKLKDLIDIKPLKCIIEDFIVIGHTHDRERRYKIYPVVKSINDNKLYFTYGSYCLSGYNTIYSQMNNSLLNMTIIRKDKTKVEIGDVAYLYLRRNLDFNININSDKNMIYLGKTKIYFNHINDINMFKELHYFEGIIDVENDVQ